MLPMFSRLLHLSRLLLGRFRTQRPLPETAVLQRNGPATKQPDPEAAARRRERRLLRFRPSGNSELDDRRLFSIDAGDSILADPIGKNPAYAEIFRAARARVDAEVGTPYEFGTCHKRWRLLQKILKEEHGITWYTPKEMNPTMIFD